NRNLGLRRSEIGPYLVKGLRADTAGWKKVFITLEIGLRAILRCASVREIGFRLLDFGRLAAGLQIGQLFFGLCELPRYLIARRPIGGLVLGKQKRARLHLIAAGHGERREQSLLRRANFDVIGVRIALPNDARGNAMLRPPPGA